MLERKAYTVLTEWKKRSNGSSALLIEGARRVGKSTLAQTFGANEYRSVMLIDFFQAPEEVKSYFKDYSTDFDTLFLYLSAFYGIELFKRESLIVFDEVQAFPYARGLIKYLVADGRYDYIETGSLLSIRQNVESIVIPSEEERLELNPLDFEEFLWAKGERALAELIKNQYRELKPLPDALHRKAMGLIREYMLVGGMPKPVDLYIETNKFQPADVQKRQILALYREDVGKFAHGYERRVAAVLDHIPGQLSKHEKRFTLASLGKDARMRTYEEAFFWLADARVANLCFACSDPAFGLALSSSNSSVKCYLADTGLLVTLAFSDNGAMDEQTYAQVLRGNIGINEGMLVENLVAQMLTAQNRKLYFYSQTGHTQNELRMEIDFLITKPYKGAANKPRISPIEVKSPRQYGITSLTRFKDKFKQSIGVQYILHPKPLKIEGDLHYLPLYMGFCL